MNKQLTFFVSFLFVLFLGGMSVDAKAFNDVPSWAEDEINYLYDNGIVKGISKDTFGSNDEIRRGDAAIMLARAKNLPLSNIPSQSSFPDVKTKDYYFTEIEAAVKAGYLSGFPDGSFGPTKPLTREQMAKIITEAYGLTQTGENPFPDISNSWAKDEIIHLAYHGISVGNSDGKFLPRQNISRAEYSVMVARAMNDDFKVDDFNQFPDIGGGEPEPEIEAREAMLTLVNIERQGRGIYPYKKDHLLMQSAQFKAEDMYDNNYFDHNSPTYGRF